MEALLYQNIGYFLLYVITTSVVLLLPKQRLQHSFGFCIKILYISDCGLFSPPFPIGTLFCQIHDLSKKTLKENRNLSALLSIATLEKARILLRILLLILMAIF